MTDGVRVHSHRARQERAGLHRCAIAAAVFSLLAVLSGAVVTSKGAGAGPGLVPLHEIISSIAAAVAMIVAIWMILKQPAKLGWIALSTVLLEGASGSFQKTPALGILHACIGAFLLAMTVAAAVCTGPAWRREPEIVGDHGWPSLGSLGRITPIFVLGQIALGAAFRHGALGVMPHLIGAMVIVMLILCICIFVMQQFPEHGILRPSANMLMTVAFIQIFLGIAAFTVRTMTTISTAVVIGVTAAHVAVGALTLALAVTLNLHIRRHVRPHRQQEETPDTAAT
jgi:hypothetical protein